MVGFCTEYWNSTCKSLGSVQLSGSRFSNFIFWYFFVLLNIILGKVLHLSSFVCSTNQTIYWIYLCDQILWCGLKWFFWYVPGLIYFKILFLALLLSFISWGWCFMLAASLKVSGQCWLWSVLWITWEPVCTYSMGPLQPALRREGQWLIPTASVKWSSQPLVIATQMH